MSRRNLGLLGGALVLAGVLAMAGGALAGSMTTGWPSWPGWMGGGMGSWFEGSADESGASVAPSQEQAFESAVPAGASVDRSTNTVSFNSQQIALTVLAAPPDGPDETFRVAGLTNPTIEVPEGARVTLQLVNADDGMPHNFLISDVQPPFPTMGMMMVSPMFGADTATLDEATGTELPATNVIFTASSAGRFTYLCSVPGHAAAGMYGTWVVRAST